MVVYISQDSGTDTCLLCVVCCVCVYVLCVCVCVVCVCVFMFSSTSQVIQFLIKLFPHFVCRPEARPVSTISNLYPVTTYARIAARGGDPRFMVRHKFH